MTPVSIAAEDAPALAAIHAVAFDAPWSAAAMTGLMQGPGVFALAVGEPAAGFILMRAIADEAEILTLAVAPDHRRQGLAQALLAAGLDQAAAAGAQTVFLEVAADNVAALALYAQAGFQPAGRRAAYYARKSAPAADALVLRKALNAASA